MDLYELGGIGLDEFKKVFEEKDEDKFIEEFEGFNILHWSFYSFNIDVVNYLLENHPYDLEFELNKKSRSIPFKDGLPFQVTSHYKPGVSLHEMGITENKYRAIFDLIKDKGIVINPLSKEQIEISFQSITRIPLLNILAQDNIIFTLLDNNHIDSYFLSENIDSLFRTNLRKGESANEQVDTFLDKILTHKNFKPSAKNINVFDKITFFSADSVNVSRKNYDNFVQGLKNSLEEIGSFSEKEVIENVIVSKLHSIRMSDNTKTNVIDKIKESLKDVSISNPDDLNINDDIMKLVASKLSIPLYLEFKELYQGNNAENLFIKAIKEEGYFEREQVRSYEHEDGWLGMKRSDFFNYQVYLPRVNILEIFKDVESPEAKEFRINWLYHYLSSIEDRKICDYYQNKQGVKVFHNDISVENNAVINDLNLKIDSSVFESPISFMAVNHYRPNVKIEENTKESEYVFLSSLFNSKLTFNEIDTEVKKIKGNSDFNVRDLIGDFISKNKKEFEFLYEESSSFEKINLLKRIGVSEPENFSLVKALHNMIMTEDQAFVEYSLDKIKSFERADFHQFVNTLLSYDHYIGIDADGNFDKEVLFIKNAQEELFDIIASPKGQALFLNNDVKDEINMLHYNTFFKHYNNNKGDGLIQDIVKDFKGSEENWSLLEKRVITGHILEDAPDLENKKKSRL